MEQLNAHLLRLLEGGSFSEELVAALRALDVAARPLFVVATEGMFSDTALLLASSLKRMQDAAMKPCAALADKKGTLWAAEVKARSIAFAHEVAGHVQTYLTALDPLLSVAVEGDFVLMVTLRGPSPLPPPALVSLEHSWVQVIAATAVYAPVAKRWVASSTSTVHCHALPCTVVLDATPVGTWV